MLSENIVNSFLEKLLDNLKNAKREILKENQKDIQDAKNKQKNSAFLERLTISETTFTSILKSLQEVIAQPFPLGNIIKKWKVSHNDLNIERITCPIGKILIIYESRPNVTIDAFSLCFKSGNSCILRGGSESFRTSSKIVEIIHNTFEDEGIPQHKGLVEYVQTTERSAIEELLTKNNEIDLIIPRGGKNLVEFVLSHTTIPILKHLDGNCHTYIENSANPQKAIEVLHNAKLRRVSICSATESLVIDQSFANNYLNAIVNSMQECEFVGCEKSVQLDGRIKHALNKDFYTEFLSTKISVKIVNGIDEAIAFINKYSSKHTEAILSENQEVVKQFFQKIDSANIMHNVSTQFADGYEFGLGAEIGIATGKMHARGPVGLQELVTYKNIISAEDYKVRS